MLCDLDHNVIISIHALREEGDQRKSYLSLSNQIFLSTPSARRATGLVSTIGTAVADFYPRPPRGGRHDITTAGLIVLAFLSTPSARRATHIYIQ